MTTRPRSRLVAAGTAMWLCAVLVWDRVPVCAVAGARPAAPRGVARLFVDGRDLGQSGQPVNEAAKVMADFRKRVDEYLALQEKLDASLPKLPEKATPKQIDEHQRALAALVQEARRDARPGDLFTPDMQALARELMARVFGNPKKRRSLRASIEDESPRGVSVTVNGRYPDNVPLTTMPPDVLRNLPPLPEDLEYRFVGRSLILLDVRAHLVVDVAPRVLPSE